MEKITASYNAQLKNKESKYYIQFETNNYTLFKKVERSCQSAVDKAHQSTLDNSLIYKKQNNKEFINNMGLLEKEYKINFHKSNI